ncbi:MAG: NUDIX domain-containing protein [Proteobacteria bacterium]|nr:NUDIX domain-containing protein [Pseudomonadota bacterium]
MINLGKTSTGYNGQSSHVIDVPVAPQGKWGETVNWRLLEGKIPNDELVTAVFGLLIVESGVVLVTTTRGYLELLGGHREAGETIEQTLDRESYEEGGVKVIERIPFGYREVSNECEIVNKATGKPYPSIGFIPLFVGTGEADLSAPLPEDVVARTIVPFDQLKNLNAEMMPDFAILQIGLRHAVRLDSLNATQKKAISYHLVVGPTF